MRGISFRGEKKTRILRKNRGSTLYVIYIYIYNVDGHRNRRDKNGGLEMNGNFAMRIRYRQPSLPPRAANPLPCVYSPRALQPVRGIGMVESRPWTLDTLFL